MQHATSPPPPPALVQSPRNPISSSNRNSCSRARGLEVYLLNRRREKEFSGLRRLAGLFRGPRIPGSTHPAPVCEKYCAGSSLATASLSLYSLDLY